MPRDHIGIASKAGNAAALAVAIADGCNIFSSDPKGNTPLLSAAQSDGAVEECVRALLAAAKPKVDVTAFAKAVNAANMDKRTSLMCVAASGDAGSVKALLLGGADAALVDSEGKSALELAQTPKARDKDSSGGAVVAMLKAAAAGRAVTAADYDAAVAAAAAEKAEKALAALAVVDAAGAAEAEKAAAKAAKKAVNDAKRPPKWSDGALPTTSAACLHAPAPPVLTLLLPAGRGGPAAEGRDGRGRGRVRRGDAGKSSGVPDARLDGARYAYGWAADEPLEEAV